ncbi:ElaA protein [Streptohalobacillus salinus]|uniref:ElaA protein n=1 Tax=Streptohalobacillus salinus TaxID=621096 RepID=A0A2V3W5D1_9BACI|nr:GNAT family N-acetyltransferase [Streptohalobacillus salinus]PXW89190.1 ElaA protein [Streptohalobacillus salinus]
MTYKLKRFEQLTLDELYAILKSRVEVFVVEQTCPYPEVDGLDPDCLHLFQEQDGEILSYCRLIPKNLRYQYPSIGRILVHPNHRKSNYGRKLVQEAIRVLETETKDPIIIHAQVYLLSFYQSLGFEAITEAYLEDGILHRDMLRQPQGKG